MLSSQGSWKEYVKTWTVTYSTTLIKSWSWNPQDSQWFPKDFVCFPREDKGKLYIQNMTGPSKSATSSRGTGTQTGGGSPLWSGKSRLCDCHYVVLEPKMKPVVLASCSWVSKNLVLQARHDICPWYIRQLHLICFGLSTVLWQLVYAAKYLLK